MSFQAASQCEPDNALWKLRTACRWPSVFDDSQAIASTVVELREAIDSVANMWQKHAPASAINSLLRIGCIPPFQLAHQNVKDRGLREAFANLVRRPCDSVTSQAESLSFDDQRIVHSERTSRRKVGFVVTAKHESLFLRCMKQIIEGLNRDQFDVTIFGSSGAVESLSSQLNNSDTRFTILPLSFEKAIQLLKEEQQDILYFWEIGSDPLNYYLPFAKSAPVQCTSWGTLVTSGICDVDYYLSSVFVEPVDAESQYTETLIRFDSLLSAQPRLVSSSEWKSREQMGFPADKKLYVCPQNLIKFHPDFDVLLAEILRRDPNGIIITKHGRQNKVGDRLRKRWQSRIPDVADRIVMLPWSTFDDYLALLQTADVILDTLHYGAGSSCYDTFSLNQPIVTLSGNRNIGRYTYGCYQMMDISECTATSTEEYVDIALMLGTDQGFRREVKQRIAERSDILFDDPKVIEQYNKFLTHV